MASTSRFETETSVDLGQDVAQPAKGKESCCGSMWRRAGLGGGALAIAITAGAEYTALGRVVRRGEHVIPVDLHGVSDGRTPSERRDEQPDSRGGLFVSAAPSQSPFGASSLLLTRRRLHPRHQGEAPHRRRCRRRQDQPHEQALRQRCEGHQVVRREAHRAQAPEGLPARAPHRRVLPRWH